MLRLTLLAVSVAIGGIVLLISGEDRVGLIGGPLALAGPATMIVAFTATTDALKRHAEQADGLPADWESTASTRADGFGRPPVPPYGDPG